MKTTVKAVIVNMNKQSDIDKVLADFSSGCRRAYNNLLSIYNIKGNYTIQDKNAMIHTQKVNL